MPDTLDAAAVRAWAAASQASLAEYRHELDALNVFPVADADTGANMLATATAGADAVAETGSGDPAALLRAWADGAARGAAGNSGFILSQLLSGFAEAGGESGRLDGVALAGGLASGAALARRAVVSPAEGTVLTVARAAAEAAADARDKPLADVARAAFDAAVAASEQTIDQLPALRSAGVVDAGGRGLVVVLRALVAVVSGVAPAVPSVRLPAPAACEPGGRRFEVQYLLDAQSVDGLAQALSAIGDSVVVVPVGEGWNVHVHVDDVGPAIEAGLDAGRPHGIRVTELHGSSGSAAVAVLAVAPGDGLSHLFRREGVAVVESDPDVLPTVDAVRAAITESGARQVVLLPNAAAVTGVADGAAALARADGLRVAVVPTRSPVQGLAAIAVHDPQRGFDDDVVAMAEAAAATRWAEIVVAEADALTAVGVCHAGDVLGLIDGEVVAVGGSLLAVAFGVLDRLVAVGGELMTVVVGQGAPPRTGHLVEQHVRERSQLVEVVVYEGGQPDVPIMIGVE